MASRVTKHELQMLLHLSYQNRILKSYGINRWI